MAERDDEVNAWRTATAILIRGPHAYVDLGAKMPVWNI